MDFPRLPDDLAKLDDEIGELSEEPPIPLIYCSLGEHWKPATREHFHVNRALKRGFCSWCIDCTRKRRGSKPFQPRRSIRPGWLHCPVCNQDKPEADFKDRKDGTNRKDSYCRLCDNRMKAEQRQHKLRTDPEYAAMDRKRRKRQDRRRQKRVVEYRHMAISRARSLIQDLKTRGIPWTVLQRETGIHQETLRRWLLDDGTKPDKPTLDRALPALERLLDETVRDI